MSFNQKWKSWDGEPISVLQYVMTLDNIYYEISMYGYLCITACGFNPGETIVYDFPHATHL